MIFILRETRTAVREWACWEGYLEDQVLTSVPVEKHWQFVVFYRPPPTNTSFQHIPLTILPTTTDKHFGPTFSNDNLWCFTDHHIQTPHFCGDSIEKKHRQPPCFSVLKKCTLSLTGMDDFCIHFYGFVYLLLLSIFRLWCNPEIIMPWLWAWWHLYTCFIH